jgi:hypothetical protein
MNHPGRDLGGRKIRDHTSSRRAGAAADSPFQLGVLY